MSERSLGGPGPSTCPVVGVLVLKTEDSERQVYTDGEAGPSQLLCADGPSEVSRAHGSAQGRVFGTDVGGDLPGFC